MSLPLPPAATQNASSITFDVEGTNEKIEVFTTRADTLMGVTYLVVAPEHPLTAKISTPDRIEVWYRLRDVMWRLEGVFVLGWLVGWLGGWLVV